MKFQYYPRYFVLNAIKFYQKTFSLDHGILKSIYPHGYCRFKPTCSEYAYTAVEKKGIVKGGLLAFWRVLRCTPFSKGGWDPMK